MIKIIGSTEIVSSDHLDKHLAKWAAERIDLNLPILDAWGECRCAGVFRDKKLLAVCVYHGYQAYYGQIQMSMAAEDPSWCTRGVLVELLDYPFRIGLRRIWVLTRTDNKRIIRLLQWIGFVREGTLVSFFGPRINAISWRLLSADYHAWLKRIGRDERRRQGQAGKSSEYGAAVERAERV